MLIRLLRCLFLLTLFLSTGTNLHAQQAPEDFKTFLSKFTSSASFQFSRVQFPLESSIILLNEKEEEKIFPFTKEMWPLLNQESFKVERVYIEEEGATYFSKFVFDEPARKEFEAGYEDSELDLRVVFELKEGKWFVTDCYNSWYNIDLPAEELRETMNQVKDENKQFIEKYP
ncbi:DUF4348 domain-containing protein [Bacteroides sp. 224]|uniref:DUF4348 domain-containing protein n=1 Tax=Bacteroides sp. 224 TaxID=2302936 RepID=UPI0013D3E37C|nr:DUF4348 domain-containing protein [Bacteroides sp. 224]NDV67094.1 DUF4348 domain-containing protein [Bacteroides sp. 224]